MAPTPPSTTPSSQGFSPEGQFRVVRKRNRIPLSCGPCRHRKLKCNRAHPCDNCTKRGDIDSCSYASPNVRKKSVAAGGTNGSPDEMQNRIDRLESLVLSLMTNGPQSAGPTAAAAALAGPGPATTSSISGSSTGFPLDVDSEMVKDEVEGAVEADESEVDQVAKSIGVMKVDNNRAFFVPEAHWYSILAEISEVKNWFQDHKKQFDEQMKRMKADRSEDVRIGAGFLFSTQRPSSKADVLREFPNKQTCDTLISRFFNTYNSDPAFHIIHGPTFQKQYDAHWLNPDETQVIWLGMVYAMMVIALQSYERNGEEPPESRGQLRQMLGDYRRLTAQCLMLADITQPINYMLETLHLYNLGEFGRHRDADTGVLLVMSMIVRLAMKMGYHRDSKYYPQITPFQGEMRRRVWCFIRHGDLLFSSQAGLPPMIRACDTNTEMPRNLYDDELYEDMKELPPSRPMTEPTPMCYIIYGAQIFNVFGRIIDAVQTLGTTSYEEVMKLDQQLREVHGNIPPLFKMRSIEESLRDTPALVMQRYTLDLVFLRCQVVLHRKFICPSRASDRYNYSRRTAIDASMEILRHQMTLHNESRSGGRLSNVKWFISSLTTHDFLLAAMVVCLDLYNTAEAERAGRQATDDIYDWSQERRASMMAALEQSLSIWDALKADSMEALKATGILTAMLSKLRAHEAQLRAARGPAAALASFGPSAAGAFAPNGVAPDDANVAPEHSAAMTLGMLSTGALTPNTANLFAAFDGAGGPAPMSATTGGASAAASSGLPQAFSSGEQSIAGASVPAPMAAGQFQALFPGGMNLGFPTMDVPAGIDWDAWDSYMAGATVDAATGSANNMWMNMNMDGPFVDLLTSTSNGAVDAAAGVGASQQQAGTTADVKGPADVAAAAQPQNSANMFAGNLFMGLGQQRGNSML